MKPVRVLPLLQLLENGVIEFKNLIEIGVLFEGRKNVVRLVLAPTGVQNARQFFEHYYPDFFIRLSSFVLEDVFRMTSVDRFQRRGIGTAIVRRAVRELRTDGVRGVHITFTPELEPFYRACGFLVILGGIIDNDLG